MTYSWAVDGYGRKHIVSNENDHFVLMCVIPSESVWACIDSLEQQEVPTTKPPGLLVKI